MYSQFMMHGQKNIKLKRQCYWGSETLPFIDDFRTCCDCAISSSELSLQFT